MSRKQDALDEVEAVEQEPDESTIVDSLASLGADLVKFANDKTRRTAKLREIEALLRSVKLDDFPELAESDTIKRFVEILRPSDLRPGETRNAGTLAEQRRDWTIEDLRQFPKRTIYPTRTDDIIWNGISVHIVEGEPVELPEPFADEWDRSVRATRNRELNKRYMLGLTDTPPDPAWMSDGTLRMRALSKLGKGTLGTGSITTGPDVVEEAEAESAEG